MILLYHDIVQDSSPPEQLCVGQALPQAVFERHIRWLKKNHPIVSLTEYLSSWRTLDFRKNKRLIALTFDDGLALTFEYIFPLLVELDIPATIFTATGHLEHGELLWFSYLRALCFENLYKSIKVNQSTFSLNSLDQRKQAWTQLCIYAKDSGNPSTFSKTLSETHPLSRGISSLYEGMSHDQLKLAVNSQLIELGAHTITHPYLNLISKEEQEKEIWGSKRTLSELIGKPVHYFAYPGGEYNFETLEVVKAAGYDASFAVIPKNLGLNPDFEISRIGVYSQSLFKLQMKTIGFADLARWIGLRVG